MLIYNELYKEDLDYAMNHIKIPGESKVLITGATGLIGSFLVDVFLYHNLFRCPKVHIYGMSRQLEKLKSRFSYACENSYLHFIESDICHGIPETESFDFIVHGASNADPGTYAQYPAETITTNILGTYHVLDYAKRHCKTRVLFTSTMEVYGAAPDLESFAEDDYGLIDFNSLRSGYPESKRTSELLVRSYADEYNVNAVIVRLGYIYGPTMTKTDNKAVAQFIRKAVSGDRIVLKSKGAQRRSYCYVADAAAGILTTLFNGNTGEAYNIANNDSVVTIAGLAQTAASIAQTEVTFDVPDALEKKGFSKPQDNVLNPEKLMKLGYRPRYTVYQGLNRTISILRELENEENEEQC